VVISGNERGPVQAFRIGPIDVGGDIQGSDGSPDAITADKSIGRLRVVGFVQFASILAGVDPDLTPVEADAQIGRVVVGGDWTASTLAAGADPVNGFFGDGDDAKAADDDDLPGVISRIAGILIRGQVQGTAAGGDHFGFVAEEIGSLSAAGAALPLTANKDDLPVGTSGDVRLHEL
jgi:hypothetical protein